MIKYFCDYCGKQLQEREGLKIRVPIPVERRLALRFTGSVNM